MASDGQPIGEERGYLATEENFAIVKAMEGHNLIVPIVGDFAGPRRCAPSAAWLKERGATVSAFYVSNVEMYLRRNGAWSAFCANVAALPLDRSGMFIRPEPRRFVVQSDDGRNGRLRRQVNAGPLLHETRAVVVGRIAIDRVDVIDAALRRVLDDQRRPLDAEVRGAAVGGRSAPGEIGLREIGADLRHAAARQTRRS